MSLLTKGNAKLGRGIFHFDLPAGPEFSCPGASEWCRVNCYARKGHFLFANVQDKYARNWEAAQDLNGLAAALCAELANLPAGTVVRLHTSGDFFSADYILMWRGLAQIFSGIRFYAYTHSWSRLDLLLALEELRAEPNVKLWASEDPSTGPAPDGWRVAKVFSSFGESSGYASCPEQTGRKPNCASCGLCFADRLRSDARLAFHTH